MKEYIVIVKDSDDITTFSIQEKDMIPALIELGMTMGDYFNAKYDGEEGFMYKIDSVYVKEKGQLSRITGVRPLTIDKTNIDILNGKLSVIGTNCNKSVIYKMKGDKDESSD